MDVVLQSHQEIARAKSVCEICHTRYAFTCPYASELCLTRVALIRCNAGAKTAALVWRAAKVSQCTFQGPRTGQHPDPLNLHPMARGLWIAPQPMARIPPMEIFILSALSANDRFVLFPSCKTAVYRFLDCLEPICSPSKQLHGLREL